MFTSHLARQYFSLLKIHNSLATPYTLMRFLLCPLDVLLKERSILYVGVVVVWLLETELLCVALTVLEHVNS